MQYLFLVVMAWMTCCAYTLYGKVTTSLLLKYISKVAKLYPNMEKESFPCTLSINSLTFLIFAYFQIVEAVKTYGKTDRFYVHKCVVFCWFLPALLPTSAFLTSEMMNNQDSSTGVEIPYIRKFKICNHNIFSKILQY